MKKQKILRQSIGIDISMSDFTARYTSLDMEGNIKHTKPKSFSNDSSGFKALLKWAEKIKDPEIELRFTMEATGIYYEKLAFFLLDKGKYVSVLMPNIAKKFNESLNNKTKTDGIDARTLGRIGVERNLPKWKISPKIYRDLKKLSRERVRLIKNRTATKSQLHAEEKSGEPMKIIIKQLKQEINFFDRQIKKVEQAMKKIIDSDEYISRKLKKIITIPGVNFITAVTITAETQGFENFTSLKQLWSYAGYDVQQRQSGKYQGRTRISKKGNRHIRRAMYMPALSATQHSKTYSRFYNRLNERKEKKKISLTAVQRKLLGLIYTLWKNDTEFIDNYEEIKANQEESNIGINKKTLLSAKLFSNKEISKEKSLAENNGKNSNEVSKQSSGSRTPTTQDRQKIQKGILSS